MKGGVVSVVGNLQTKERRNREYSFHLPIARALYFRTFFFDTSETSPYHLITVEKFQRLVPKWVVYSEPKLRREDIDEYGEIALDNVTFSWIGPSD